MNDSNDNIRHNTRLGRHKRQDMSVTIDVNDVFEEVVKQNERLVKEIEFYEEVVNDLITNVKTCIVCQQNDVIKDRISELETHLKCKTIDKSIKVKSEYKDCDNKLKTNLKTKRLQKSNKRCVKEVTDSNISYDDNESDRSWTTNSKVKTSMKSNKRNEKIILKDVEKVKDIKSKTIKTEKQIKLYSDEYEEKRQKLKDNGLTSDGSYQCQTCDYKSIKFIDFETHVNRYHLNIKPFKCHICGDHFVGYDNLRRHKSLKHYYVGQALDQLSDKRKSQIAQTLSKFQCQYCQKFIHCESDLKQHVARVHHNVKSSKTIISCDLCEKFYSNRATLIKHKRFYHGIGKKLPIFYCDWEGCQYKSVNSTMLEVHKKRHLGIRDYACDWPGCEIRTYTSSSLEIHKLIHTDNNDDRCQWPGCDYKAKNKYQIKKHMKRIHEDIPRTHACHWPGCDKTFKFAYSLTKYLNINIT
ncbi:zinc finger protein 729-like [Oppia nitens]|uniref:zinc finger protein 729-like n=1 Tax=Oppia nitens TaxID=1686743 RepID=UPI0023DA35DE|nr:zinc finger protein 729-like [Oppia nitens]